MQSPGLTMFRFRCPLCGAAPGPRPLRGYLLEWWGSPPERLGTTLTLVKAALGELATSRLWFNKKEKMVFLAAIGEARQAIEDLPPGIPVEEMKNLTVIDGPGYVFMVNCPVCGTLGGRRSGDNYFSAWPEGCKVQTANLFYEMGLIIWAVQQGFPDWMNLDLLAKLGAVRRALRGPLLLMNMNECPQCGRFTTMVFGETEETGACRWCYDAAGGLFVGIEAREEEGGWVEVEAINPDPMAPARAVRSLLPPRAR